METALWRVLSIETLSMGKPVPVMLLPTALETKEAVPGVYIRAALPVFSLPLSASTLAALD